MLRQLVAPIGAVIVALSIASPAAAAPRISVMAGAHVQFDHEAGDGRFRLMVDLEHVHGQALLDVEYWQVECDAAEPPKTCLYTSRVALDVVPSKSRFSLSRATATARLTGTESSRSCTYSAGGDEMNCTEWAPSGPFDTRLELTWTGQGELSKEEWTDEDGARHVALARDSRSSGTAFERTWTVQQSLINKMARSISYHP